MTREQQDKLWNDLSAESKDYVLSKYNNLEPERCEADRDTKLDYEGLFGSHNLNPKPLTYEDVEEEMNYYFSDEMMAKEKAIHQLLLVAKYLNGDWKPDWNYIQDKWYLAVNKGKIKVDYLDDYHNSHIVYFRTNELALQAIQILGEETIRLALSTDY